MRALVYINDTSKPTTASIRFIGKSEPIFLKSLSFTSRMVEDSEGSITHPVTGDRLSLDSELIIKLDAKNITFKFASVTQTAKSRARNKRI